MSSAATGEQNGSNRTSAAAAAHTLGVNGLLDSVYAAMPTNTTTPAQSTAPPRRLPATRVSSSGGLMTVYSPAASNLHARPRLVKRSYGSLQLFARGS